MVVIDVPEVVFMIVGNEVLYTKLGFHDVVAVSHHFSNIVERKVWFAAVNEILDEATTVVNLNDLIVHIHNSIWAAPSISFVAKYEYLITNLDVSVRS